MNTKIQKLIKIVIVPLIVYVMGTCSSFAYRCYDSTGNTLVSGTGNNMGNAYVNLQPNVLPGQNLVVDLSKSIFCRNDDPLIRKDEVTMVKGSIFGGALANFRGSLSYYGVNNSFPLVAPTHRQNFPSGEYVAWNTQLYLTPINAAGGIVIKKGTHFATLVMQQFGSNLDGSGNLRTEIFTWHLYTNNEVVIPIGGCDVSARNVFVNLPEYPSTAPVPLSVHCASNQNLSFYISGQTDSSPTIFSNVFPGGDAAKGIGIELVRNGAAIPIQQKVSLGTVGSSAVNLGLSARYGRTTGQVTAGKVQSVIGVTFTYD
nr:fimbrial protein [Providencia rettgeri]